jgi:serine/threonine protein kinase
MNVSKEYYDRNAFGLFEMPAQRDRKSSITKTFWKEANQEVILKFSVVESPLVPTYKANFRRLTFITHPNIITHYKIYDLDESFLPFTLVEVLELASDGNLSDSLKKMANEGLLIEVLIDVFNGLHNLHKENILHRDIKGTNILLHKNNSRISAKISDIELSMPVINGKVCCMTTPEFLAPEATDYFTYSVKSEIWAMGVMLYEIFTGKYPFGSRLDGLTIESIQERSSTIEPDLITKVPFPYKRIVEQCLQKDEGRRPQSFASLSKMLSPSSMLIYKLKEIWNSQ